MGYLNVTPATFDILGFMSFCLVVNILGNSICSADIYVVMFVGFSNYIYSVANKSQCQAKTWL